MLAYRLLPPPPSSCLSLVRLPSSLPSDFPPVCRWRQGGLVLAPRRLGVIGSVHGSGGASGSGSGLCRRACPLVYVVLVDTCLCESA